MESDGSQETTNKLTKESRAQKWWRKHPFIVIGILTILILIIISMLIAGLTTKWFGLAESSSNSNGEYELNCEANTKILLSTLTLVGSQKYTFCALRVCICVYMCLFVFFWCKNTRNQKYQLFAVFYCKKKKKHKTNMLFQIKKKHNNKNEKSPRLKQKK